MRQFEIHPLVNCYPVPEKKMVHLKMNNKPEMKRQEWYQVNHPEEIDSPALLIFKDRVASNIQKMIGIAGDAERLVPHVKTHKMGEIVKMQVAAGIQQFKCATIAEAEMLAVAGAKNILLAYQLTGPKTSRYIALIKKYPGVHFASLVDNMESASILNNIASQEGIIAEVFIDVDSGMHRTGIAVDDTLVNLYIQLQSLKNIKPKGLHIYDGHINNENFELRKKQCEAEFKEVNKRVKEITDAGYPVPKLIVGGSPTFTIHALHKELYCSPGTCVLWDQGYDVTLTEQPFDFAAVLLTRVISKPVKGIITTDLGHKSVASENPISKRIFFLNLKEYKVHSQSEEHLEIEVKDWENIHVGDVLYGVPYHICPTVALYDEANIIESGNLIDKWNILARKRKITF
jgi:D-serine deaminase-like pyridoxal phosphate-dependent protein